MKKQNLQLIVRLGCAALLAGSAACSGVAGNPPTPMPSAQTAAATPRQQIVMQIGNAECDSDAQCHTLPLGHRACGGPETYLAYSSKTGNADKLQRLAAEESAVRKEQDARSGMVSTCQMVIDPGASCQTGRCVAGNAKNAAQ